MDRIPTIVSDTLLMAPSHLSLSKPFFVLGGKERHIWLSKVCGVKPKVVKFSKFLFNWLHKKPLLSSENNELQKTIRRSEIIHMGCMGYNDFIENIRVLHRGKKASAIGKGGVVVAGWGGGGWGGFRPI
jgi:hypothetical protein